MMELVVDFGMEGIFQDWKDASAKIGLRQCQKMRTL